jgi:hypothetical protein
LWTFAYYYKGSCGKRRINKRRKSPPVTENIKKPKITISLHYAIARDLFFLKKAKKKKLDKIDAANFN